MGGVIVFTKLSDRVQQVFGVKLSLEQPFGLAKLGIPADAVIPLQCQEFFTLIKGL